ncbi:hypothetical protein [Rhizobium laguerreae]|uniref:hypothetical protein n=1 Tax=Rhizobium laguerreae TaxID=1076926 RepID=UPI001C90F774|nr:hypothetical protein [Rhizobium laguerreae]MBY3116877.1 hypothetical protein [Rhizobium laguerreae]MBY3190037.1 hypothetical protein [Rhizobium laguerreae]
MRLLINVFVATMMLLGSLAAPCIAAPADHGHADPAVISVPATSDGHHRGYGRFVLGSHCQQDGIVAQAPKVRCSLSDVVAFGIVPSVAFAGVLEPVEQRPPIASV